MSKTEELRVELRKKEEVLEKLIELWKNNASVDDTMKIIEDAGIDTSYEEVEKLLAFVQKKQAEGISFEKLDANELANVSGGICVFGMTSQGSGDTCSDHFKEEYYQREPNCNFDEFSICLSAMYCDKQAQTKECSENYSPYYNSYTGEYVGKCVQTYVDYTKNI